MPPSNQAGFLFFRNLSAPDGGYMGDNEHWAFSQCFAINKALQWEVSPRREKLTPSQQQGSCSFVVKGERIRFFGGEY